MHQVTLTINNLERTTQEIARYQKYAYLTFKTADGKLQWWQVDGWPRIFEGMTVTALLSDPIRPNRSNRVLGWICHDTGEEAYYSQPPTAHCAGIFAIAAGLLFLKMNAEISNPPLLIFGIVSLLCWVVYISKFIQQRIIIRKLRSIRENIFG